MNLRDFNIVLDMIRILKIRKWLDEDIQMLFKILYWCALRPTEGIKSKKSDYNFTNRTVKLGETKGKKNQFALIPQRFCTELEDWLVEKDEILFPGLTYDTFYRWIMRLGVICHIEAWTTPQSITGEKTKGHIFRKSIGKAMVYGEITRENGEKIEIPIISKHLRHKKPSMTIDHYLKASMAQVAEIF